MLALVLAGGLSTSLALVFLVVMVVSWMLENTKWQLPERYGLGIVLLSIPLFYLDWQYQKTLGEPVERLGVTALAHLIVFLSAVKLIQVKKDRDWVFLYLISFFEVLLAAGLSFSPVFLGTLTLYLLCGLSAVTAFEIQKARRALTSPKRVYSCLLTLASSEKLDDARGVVLKPPGCRSSQWLCWFLSSHWRCRCF